jgi:hypothetical protein
MTSPYAFTFWQPVGETPGYIELCLRSLRRNLPAGFNHVHLDLESAKEWVPEHELLWEMSVPEDQGNSISLEGRRLALFSDMMRVALIRHHGGLWIDADTLVFPQFRLLADLVADFDLVCGEAPRGVLSNGVMGGRAGSPFFERYWSTMLAQLQQKRAQHEYAAAWGEFGFQMLTRDVFLELGPERAWVAPWGVLNTIDHNLPRPTFEPGTTIAETLSPSALDLTIYNNGTSADHRALSVEKLLADETLLAEAYRVAMGELESPHLSIRDGAQLRALNYANVIHRRLADGDKVRIRLRDRTGQRDTLRERLDERTAQNAAVRERLAQQTAQRDALRERLTERNAQRDALRERLRQRTGQRDDLRKRLKERNAQVDRLRARVAELERPLGQLRADGLRAKHWLAGRPLVRFIRRW